MIKYVKYYLLFISFIIPNNREYTDFEIIVNDNPYPGKIFVHTQVSEYMAILDETLLPYWYIKSHDVGGIDFKQNGNYLSYFNKINNYWIIADENMEEIDTLQCTTGMTDYHDIRMLDNGNYILQAYDSLIVDMSILVPGGDPNAIIKGILRIQEFNQNDELVFNWFAFDHLDIQDYSNLNLTNHSMTWMHGNSIEVDDDNNLILSNRRSSELIKIDRITGEIIWILGGPLNEYQIINDNFDGFSKQHDARRISNGNILLFDNGNTHNPPTSRVAEYQVDEDNKIATLVWEFLNPYNELSLSMGSCQRLPNGNTLINWGNTMYPARIMEVEYDKDIVLEFTYNSGHCYKVRKSDWEFNIPMSIGDANLDSQVNILDILYQINFILYNDNSLGLFNLYKIDLNKDGSIDITDIINLANIILY